MRVFLTGGTGFVGRHVARALVGGGHEVRALRRADRRGIGDDSAASLHWVAGDLLDPPSLRDGMRGCEAVVHVGGDVTRIGSAAARAHQRLVNVDGTRNVVEAALGQGVRRLVHTSSVVTLGRPSPGTIGNEDTPYDWPPGLTYHESKRDGERAALAAAARGLEVVVLCPSLTFGPGDPRRRLQPLLRAIRIGLARVAPPGGITLCDVRHVGAAHAAALTHGRSGHRYVLGGAHLAWRELLQLLADAVDAPGPVVTAPPLALRVAVLPLAALERLVQVSLGGDRLATLIAECFYSSAKAIAELGYQETAADQLVADTVSWY